MILYAVPKPVASLYGAGNWKDVIGLEMLLREAGHSCAHVDYTPETIEAVVERCGPDITDLLVHYSTCPELLERVRARAPAIRLHVRAHNAEALQLWHRDGTSLWPTRRNLRLAYGMARTASRDARCRRLADGILGISEWDNRQYWERLPGRARVLAVPYHCPWPWLRPQTQPAAWTARPRTALCMAGARDGIGRANVEGFSALARAVGAASGNGERWRFQLSPGTVGANDAETVPEGVTRMDRMDEPWDALCQARAVAVLTPLGYGAKTTVVDGLAAGCHVIVHPRLACRLPEAVRNVCIVWDPRDVEGGRRLHTALEMEPVAAACVNLALRNQALAALREALSQPNAPARTEAA